MVKTVVQSLKNIEEERLYALLGYCFLLCVVPLIFRKDSSFAVFHGRQGLALFLIEMVFFIISIIFPIITKPFLLLFTLCSLLGMIKALQGQRFCLPVVYSISKRLAM